MRHLYKLIALTFILLFTYYLPLVYINADSTIQPLVGISDRQLIVVPDQSDFYYALPYAMTQDFPLVIGDEDNKEIADFNKYYQGDIVQIDKALILARLESFQNKEAIVIAEDANKRYMMLGSHMASILKCPFINSEDVGAVLGKRTLKEAIVLGDCTVDNDIAAKIVRLDTLDKVKSYYNALTEDHSLNVYSTEDDMGIVSAYLAARRNGRIIFQLEDIEKRNSYFALVTKPKDFYREGYKELFRKLYHSKQQQNTKGIGVITGNTLQDANLLLLRSFFYEQLNRKNKYVNIEALLSEEGYEKSEKDGYSYISIRGKGCTIEKINHEIKDASQISIFAHGSPTGFSLVNDTKYAAADMPNLSPCVFTAESCETIGFAEDGSIALEAIAKGAVVYIGSTKTGGVASPFLDKSYMFSTQEIPLSSLVLMNNVDMMKTIENEARAVLIGDPVFGMYTSIGQWVSETQYTYDIGFESKGDGYSIPINFENRKYKGAIVTTDNKKYYTEVRRLINNGTSTAFIGLDNPSGTIQFTKGIHIISRITSMRNYLVMVMGLLINQALVLGILKAFMLILGVCLYMFLNRENGPQINKEQVIAALMSSLVICIIEIGFFSAEIDVIKFITYGVIILLTSTITGVVKQYLYLQFSMLLPVAYLFYEIFNGINVVIFCAPSVLLFTGMLLLISHVAKVVLRFVKPYIIQEKPAVQQDQAE